MLETSILSGDLASPRELLPVLERSLKGIFERLHAAEDGASEAASLLQQSASAADRLADLETQLQVARNELESLRECNARYEAEREQLTAAISSLRGALGRVKENLIQSDAERKQLKEEVVRLHIQLEDRDLNDAFEEAQ